MVGPLLGLIVCLLGLNTTLGWLLHVPAMVEIKQGLVPMVFNTGLCFLLAGAALALHAWQGADVARARTVIASLLIGLCGLTLLEIFFDRSLFGIDLAGVHAWYDYGNKRPGRMAPNTALGFFVAACAILVGDRVTSRGRGITEVALTFLLLTIGLTGLVGYLLAPDLLFNWAKSARMALHTATGMIVLALALWLSWSRSDWYTSEAYFREDAKVRLLSGSILIIVATTAALAGFVFQQDAVQSALQDRLTAVVRARGPWLQLVAKDMARHAGEAADLSGLNAKARTLLDGIPPKESLRKEMRSLADAFAKEGWRRVSVGVAGSDSIAVLGPTHTQPEFDAPLDQTGAVELLWDGALMLRVTQTLSPGSQAATVRVVMERQVPELAAAMFSVAGLGESGEIAICIMRASNLSCLPTRWQPKPFTLAPRPTGSSPLPMQLALVGQRGVVQGIDYRQQNVLAAYGQLAPGLGFVAKQDAVEVYAPIRRALAIGAPLMVLVSLVGALLMVWQLSPLVSRMRRAERVASNAAVKMQTIVESAGDGIVTVAEDGRIESANTAAHRIFGYEPGQLQGRNLAVLIPAEPHAADLIRQAPNGDPPHPHDTQVEAVRRDGSRFPLEWTINSAPLQGQSLSVVILRDITGRKELEEKLSRLAQYDQLTGLPNRALFMDRLATAALRAGRSRRALAVLFLDLDGFKSINDDFGHREGDAVLVQTAQRLSSAVRKTDTVARLGGDEFTIILEQLTHPVDDVQAIAEKIVQAMRTPFVVQGQAQQVTVSIGAAVHPDELLGISTTVLLNKADDAMYAAKRAGKNAFRMTVVSELTPTG